MVITQLSAELEQASRDLLRGLDDARVRVTAAFWNLFEGGWRFVLELPDLVEGGPIRAYATIREVLESNKIGGLTIGEIAIAKPSIWHTRLLRSVVKSEGTGRTRVTDTVVSGQLIQDAVVYRLFPQEAEPGATETPHSNRR